ncbi:MAG: hypothetical protein J2P19_20265 [Pseudonocardia sp.]|nr:hypothetical protein [Pseudonocardia sp.]
MADAAPWSAPGAVPIVGVGDRALAGVGEPSAGARAGCPPVSRGTTPLGPARPDGLARPGGVARPDGPARPGTPVGPGTVAGGSGAPPGPRDVADSGAPAGPA